MVAFIFIQILIEHSVANSGDPDQTLRSAVSGLGLHCLPMSHKKDARLKWVKHYHAEYLYYTFHNFNSGAVFCGATVCLCPTKKTLGLNGLRFSC